MRPTAAQMAASLGLAPHPEGGYYRETYRAAQTLVTPRGERPASTAIVFLITAGPRAASTGSRATSSGSTRAGCSSNS